MYNPDFDDDEYLDDPTPISKKKIEKLCDKIL